MDASGSPSTPSDASFTLSLFPCLEAQTMLLPALAQLPVSLVMLLLFHKDIFGT